MTQVPTVLRSYIAGRWFGDKKASELPSAVNGKAVAFTHEETIDFGEALTYARTVGLRELLKFDFQQRASILRALGKYFNDHKEELYAVSAHTGATRGDSWIDIEGGFGTLFAYARVGRDEFPSSNTVHEGPVVTLGKQGKFVGTHVLVPREGVALHINAFNFPIWGMLEKFAPSFLAGMPCLVKPATSTSYLAEAAVRLIERSGLVPAGALQLIIGGVGDAFDRLEPNDAVTFTGSAQTAMKLRSHPHLLRNSIPFNAEADSLNCAILAPDVSPNDEEFDLFVKEVAREMTVKAGQKCTAIRRAIVPAQHAEAVASRLQARLGKLVVGDPAVEGVRMGPLASKAQQRDVGARLAELSVGNQVLVGGEKAERFAPVGEGVNNGAFFPATLLLCRDGLKNKAVHEVEAFGPVSTIITYSDPDEALALAALGRGSLVGTVVTKDPALAAKFVRKAAVTHGRMLVLDREAAEESTGHGSPLPQLKHGGPGRAGGGEELGGARAVHHFLQRAAVQGSPTMVAAVAGEYVAGARGDDSGGHPFLKYFEDLRVGDTHQTHRRTISEADIVNFGGISGDYFYMHFDELAAKDSQFGARIAHGYFVLSAAAGLFVHPAVGPLLANYGIEKLRFVKPVYIGDTIRARLTSKRKIDRNRVDAKGIGQGVVVWYVEVTNQRDELVAACDIMTLVRKKHTP